MFNHGLRGRRAGDNSGTISLGYNYIDTLSPQVIVNGYSVSGIDDKALDPAGGQTVIVTGGGFATGITGTLGGVVIGAITYISPTQVSFTSPAKAGGLYVLVLTNTSGSTGALVPGVVYSSVPTFTTPAGSIGTFYETTSYAPQVVATSDSTITYTLASGSLPPSATLNSSTGVISGSVPVIASGSTTYSFSITATDTESQDVTRSFTITQSTDILTWVTPSSGATISLDGSAYSQVLSATDAAGYSVTYSANTLPTGLSLNTATISGTPTVEATTTTLLTATAATTGRSQTNTISWVVVLGDSYWKFMTMLLSANASVQTSSFVTDNSNNNQQLTVVGDTRSTSFNIYQPGYFSTLFDGSSGYTTSATNTQMNLGSGDYTVEFWCFSNSLGSSSSGAMYLNNYTPTGYVNLIRHNGSVWECYYKNALSFSSVSFSTAGVPGLNQWAHHALVRSSTNVKWYINGILRGTGVTDTTDYSSGTAYIQNGMYANMFYDGYISNFRFVKGTALYTGGTTVGDVVFTPSTTPLLPVNNTLYLAHNSYNIKDISSNNTSITTTGTVKVSPYIPFTTKYVAGTQYYSTDISVNTDYLNVPSNAVFGMGTGNFTIEGWFWPTAVDAGMSVTWRIGTINGANSMSGGVATNLLTFRRAGTTDNTASVSIANTWSHVAWVRSGSTVTIYLNGAVATSFSDSTSISTGDCTIGYESTTFRYYGKVSNFRVVKAVAVYTGAFTPPTSPLTATQSSGTNISAITAGQTSLLTCQNSTFIDNSTNNFTITAGSTTIKPLPISPFTPSSYTATTIPTTYGSAYFDGTGDYLTIPVTTFLLPTSTYTIECYFYPVATPGGTNGAHLFQLSNSNAANFGGLFFTWYGTGNFKFEVRPSTGGVNATVTTASTYAINQWYHVAVSVNAGSAILFVNGVNSATLTVSAMDGTQTYQSIGYLTNGYTTSQAYINGYISDFRIIKGTALYTSNFVPGFITPLTNVTNTQLLTLQSNGSHNNNVFLDNSIVNNLITRNGNPTLGTFSPYGDNWSCYFDSSLTSYLNTSASTNNSLGSGDYTVEFYCYSNTLGTGSAGCPFYISDTGGVQQLIRHNGSIWECYYKSGTSFSPNVTIPTGNITLNTWTHHALVRSSGTVKWYINGTQYGSASDSTNFSNSTQFFIGQYATYYYDGYVSNVRVVKGTALYTSAFTPSTAPLVPVTGTIFLAANTYRFIDTSVNNSTLTINGSYNRSVKFSPFQTITIPKYYSTYFGAKTDYISTPAVTNLTTFTGDFTFEAWIYPSDTSITYWGIWDSRQSGGTSNPMVFMLEPLASPVTGQGRMKYFNGTTYYGTGTVNYNVWTHVAWVRSSSTMTFYINGVAGGTATVSGTQTGNASTNPVYIGSKDNASASYGSTGYISNFRIVNGIAVYTGNFTPPTSPLTATQSAGTNIAAISGSQTVLLTCQNNTAIDNSSNYYAMTLGSTTVKPLPVSPFTPTVNNPASYSPSIFGGSMYFDGTGDYLVVPAVAGISGTGYSWTIQGWFYAINFAGTQCLIDAWNGGTTAFLVRLSGSQLDFYTSPGSSTSVTSLVALQWYHFAVVYTTSNTTIQLYLNGLKVGTAITSYTTSIPSTSIGIGAHPNNGLEPFIGWLSDIQIIKGALYTNNFYPDLSPFTPTVTIGATTYSTSLLLSGTSSGITDATRTVDLETVGDAKVVNGFSPYLGSYYSNYFNGSSDVLTVPSNTAYAFGTGDFTIEAYVYLSAYNGTYGSQVFGGHNYGVGADMLFIVNTTGKLFFQISSSSAGAITSTSSVSLNTWTHIAVVRISGTVTPYINGANAGGGASYTTSVASTINPGIGSSSNNNNAASLTGYISNLRVIKGTGIYTTTFTPSTSPLTTTSQGATAANVSLLTCQSNRFIDNSTNAFTLTITGTPKVQTQNPFQINTGLSYYFDGTGDYINTSLQAAAPTTNNFQFNIGDFTLEFWVYFNSTTGGAVLLDFRTADGSVPTIYVPSTATTTLAFYATSADRITSSAGSIVTGQWIYVAVARSSGSTKMFLNGTQAGSTYSDTISYSVGPLRPRIGASGIDASLPLNGYIADLRITRGYARYTSNFTAPTSPFKTK